MRLVLIRHGRTRANEEHLYCGSTDLPLSENGRRELETLRNSFSYPAAEGFRFFTSGQLRTEQTLELIGADTGADLRPQGSSVPSRHTGDGFRTL